LLEGFFSGVKSSRDGLIRFLESDFFPIFIAISFFSSMLLDHDVSYTTMIQSPDFFRIYEDNSIFKTYAGTNLWFIPTIREIGAFSLIVLGNYKIKDIYFRLIFLIISFHVFTAFLSWILKIPLFIELIPLTIIIFILLVMGLEREN